MVMRGKSSLVNAFDTYETNAKLLNHCEKTLYCAENVAVPKVLISVPTIKRKYSHLLRTLLLERICNVLMRICDFSFSTIMNPFAVVLVIKHSDFLSASFCNVADSIIVA